MFIRPFSARIGARPVGQARYLVASSMSLVLKLIAIAIPREVTLAERLTWRDGYSDALLGRPRHSEYRVVDGTRDPRGGFPEYQAGYSQGLVARARAEGDAAMPSRERGSTTAPNWPVIAYIVGLTLVVVLRLKWFLWYLWIGALVFLLALAMDSNKGPHARFLKTLLLAVLLTPAVGAFLVLQFVAAVSFTFALIGALAVLTVVSVLQILYGVFNFLLRWVGMTQAKASERR